MRIRQWLAVLAGGAFIGVGCSSSGDGDGDGGAAGAAAAAASAGDASAGDSSLGGSGGSANAAGAGATSNGGTANTAGTAGSGNTAGEGWAGAISSDGGEVVLDGGGTCNLKTCQGKLYQCGNCVDDDGDGFMDDMDPDCLSPCDNNEAGFFTKIPGGSWTGGSCGIDCYYDQDSGGGNDQCYWNLSCDPKSKAPNYPPSGDSSCVCKSGNGGTLADGGTWPCQASTPGTNKTCAELYETQTEVCEKFCGPLTPNGCDCFGCCELPAHSGSYVWIGSYDKATKTGTCTLDKMGDPTACRPCTPVAACLNTCEKCELCLGKTEEDLLKLCPPPPPDAGAGGSPGSGGTPGSGGSGGGCPTPFCPGGAQPCGVSCLPNCPAGFYCSTGCCQPVPT
jgi:hypothetical protein